MNTTISIGDMINLDDGQKVLSRYNELIPGVVEKAKQQVRDSVVASDKLSGTHLDIDTMLDEAFIVVASMCARNNDAYLSNCDEAYVAKSAATLSLVALATFALFGVDLVCMESMHAEKMYLDEAPPHKRGYVSVRNTIRLFVLNKMIPRIKGITLDLASAGIDATQGAVHSAAVLMSEQGLTDHNARRNQ